MIHFSFVLTSLGLPSWSGLAGDRRVGTNKYKQVRYPVASYLASGCSSFVGWTFMNVLLGLYRILDVIRCFFVDTCFAAIRMMVCLRI